MENKTVDDYRQQFKIAPIGRWSWAVGSSGIVMNQVWVFYSCHTGHYIDYGPFGYPRRQTHFQWREVAEFTILIGETGWEYLEPVDEDDNGEMEPEDSAEEIEWMTIRYDFKEVEHDSGKRIAMFDIGREEEGFYFYGAPLEYVGPIEESE